MNTNTAMLDFFITALSYPFMVRALIAGLIIGIATAVLSIFITLRNMSFYSNAISHSALAGIAIGILLGLPPFPAAVVFCVLLGLATAYIHRRSSVSTDTLMGVLFAAGMALGITIISQLQTIRANLFSYLFGDILAVSWDDIWISSILGAVIILYMIIYGRRLLLVTFSPDFSAMRSVSVKWLDYSFFVITALAIAISIKIIGLILVSGLLVLPAAIAKNIARSFSATVVVAVMVSIITTLIGIAVSYSINVPSGPAIILAGAALFLISLLFRRN